MKSKSMAFGLVFSMLLFTSIEAQAAVKEAASSLLLPTTGQAMNGQLGNTKTKIMGGLEFTLATTAIILGGAVGGPVVWVAAGPLLANHVWSSADAFVAARNRKHMMAEQGQLQEAQRVLEDSRERRFEREEQYRSDVRDRIRTAGEQGYY